MVLSLRKFKNMLTSRNMNPIRSPMTKKQDPAKFGNAKGNFLKNALFPKVSGKFFTGFAKEPPNMGPNILPIVHTRGMILNARGCSSRSGTISATAVRIMPTFPLPRPVRARAATAMERFWENPNMSVLNIVQAKPLRRIGLRPKRSEAKPQGIPMRH